MISFKQLSYALAVEKTLHFKKAAEHCHISQSALSTALNELEKQLGFQVFERDNKKVLVTPLGHEVLDRARKIVSEVDDLQHLAESRCAPLSFPITLGMIPTIAPYLLPRILPALNEQYPQLDITVVEEQSHVLVDKVQRGEIDAAVLALPYPCEGLLTLEFWQEDFYWVAPDELVAPGQDRITSKELASKKLMLLKDGHCLKDHVLDVCRFGGSDENQSFGAASLSTLIQMVIGHLGTTLIPAMARPQLLSQNAGVSTIRLDEPGPHRRIAFAIRPNYTRMSSIEALIDICKAQLGETL